MNSYFSKTYLLIILGFSLISSFVHAEESEHEIAHHLADRLHPMVSVPFEYYYFQKTGPQHNQNQNQVEIQPFIPITLNSDWKYLIRPGLSADVSFEPNKQGTPTNQYTPVQIQSYFTTTNQKDTFTWGVGPYLQVPAGSIGVGSKQYGAGISAGAFYKPKHWTIGAITYNSWALGGPTYNGTANFFYISPEIAYTNDNAYTFSVFSQTNFNYNSRQTSSPVYFTVSKLVKIMDQAVQFQIGPSYNLNNSNTTAGKGIGGYFQATIVFPE